MKVWVLRKSAVEQLCKLLLVGRSIIGWKFSYWKQFFLQLGVQITIVSRRECNNANLLSLDVNVVGSCIYVCHRSSGAKLNMPPALIDITEEDYVCMFVCLYLCMSVCGCVHPCTRTSCVVNIHS